MVARSDGKCFRLHAFLFMSNERAKSFVAKGLLQMVEHLSPYKEPFMADYTQFIDKAAQSYRRYVTIESLIKSFEKKMKDRFSIRFIPPTFDTKYVAWQGNHPYGGKMDNWSRFPRVDGIEYKDMANIIKRNNLFTPLIENFTTHPETPQMMMYLNTLAPHLHSLIRVHEFEHMITHKIPFDLVYIYAQKKYNQMVNEGFFRGDDQALSNWLLAENIKSWMKASAKQDPLFCRDGQLRFDDTRIAKMKQLVDKLDRKIDEDENQETIFYTSTPLDDDWINFYDCFISDIDSP